MTDHVQMLPENICEQIINYLPADSYSRAHWSRYNLCSQEFYDAIIQAFLKVHFVPESYVDKVINRYFATFCAKQAAKRQAFQEKIKRAFLQYTGPDTLEYELFKYSLEELQRLGDFIDPACAVLVTYDDQQLHEYLVKLKSDRLLKEVIKMAQKQYSKALLYRESIKEHIMVYGDKNTQVCCKMLEFFEPFEYLGAKIAKNTCSIKADFYIGCCTVFYCGIVFLLLFIDYLEDQAKLSGSAILRTCKPHDVFWLFNLALLMQYLACMGTLGATVISAELIEFSGKSYSDLVRYNCFLTRISRRLKAAIVQAQILAQV